jgi:hypothetical protein
MSRAISPTTTSTPQTTLSPADARRVRRGGWLLVVSFLMFVGFVAAIIFDQSGYGQAAQDAADRLGVGVNDVPAEVLAPINREYSDSVRSLVLLVWVLVVFGLFIAGLRTAAAIAGPGRRRSLRNAMTGLAALTPLCWVMVFLLDFGISVQSPPQWVLRLYDAGYGAAIAANTVGGSLALMCLVVLLRPTRIARRTGVVVLALSALGTVAAVSVGAPPIVPLLLGAALGLVMIRGVRLLAVA